MSDRLDIHFEMLDLQVASIFKYYEQRVVRNKWAIANFEPMVDDGKIIVSYLVDQDPVAPARRRITIKVMVEDRPFKFMHNYNFGVPLDSMVEFRPSSSRDKDLIDLEYALSIATEHMASQLSVYKEG